MEWWQIVSILLASIAAGAAVGALLSYLIMRFAKKRETTFSSDFPSRFARTPEAPEASLAPAEAGGDELYQGRVELEITAPIVDFAQMLKLQTHLREVPDLQLLSVGGSTDGGTRIVVVVDKPLRLASILSEMPLAKYVVKREKNIQVVI